MAESVPQARRGPQFSVGSLLAATGFIGMAIVFLQLGLERLPEGEWWLRIFFVALGIYCLGFAPGIMVCSVFKGWRTSLLVGNLCGMLLTFATLAIAGLVVLIQR